MTDLSIIELSITEFIGRFHPLLVHLPIGILLMALLMQWLSRKERYHISPQVMIILWLCGMFSALLACITGLMLSAQGDYDENMVALHMWMGIFLAAVSMFLVMKAIRRELDNTFRIVCFVLLAFIVVTGHSGASLTHGAGYLTAPSESRDTVVTNAPKSETDSGREAGGNKNMTP